MPRAGIGLKAGWHLGFEDELPPGVELNVPISDDSVLVEENLKHGFFFGASLSAQIFKDIFAMIFKP
jgi:hypothetical protein